VPKLLSQFSITAEADGYVLHLEDEDGETTEFTATVDQLDEITMAIEDLDVVDDDDASLLADDEDELGAADDD
jgi:hypothetical protein